MSQWSGISTSTGNLRPDFKCFSLIFVFGSGHMLWCEGGSSITFLGQNLIGLHAFYSERSNSNHGLQAENVVPRIKTNLKELKTRRHSVPPPI